MPPEPRLLGFGHLENVERPAEFGRHFVELCRRNLEFTMGLFETEIGMTGAGRGVFEGTARDVAYPERAHELQSGEPAKIVGMPFTKFGIFGFLTNVQILHKFILRTLVIS